MAESPLKTSRIVLGAIWELPGDPILSEFENWTAQPTPLLKLSQMARLIEFLIYSTDDTTAIVVSLEVGEGHIQTIWAIANPDKLSRL